MGELLETVCGSGVVCGCGSGCGSGVVLSGQAEQLMFTHLVLVQITALKNLNLNIRRAKLTASGKANMFFITGGLCNRPNAALSPHPLPLPHSTPGLHCWFPEAETSDKIVKSARLEEIRMTVINSLIGRFPVSC